MSLRKAIRTARNRTESYHQLQGLLRKIYCGVFKWIRLVANCIVAYNSLILNAIYEKMVKERASQETIDEFARISPVV